MSEPTDEGFIPLTRDEIVEIIRHEMKRDGQFADNLFQWLDARGILEQYELNQKPVPLPPSDFDRRER